jgi:hypothetical protein
MAEKKDPQQATARPGSVDAHLAYRKLSFSAQPYTPLAPQAAHKGGAHGDYLTRLVEGEANMRRDRATQSRIRRAHFPVIKTLEQFRWD